MLAAVEPESTQDPSKLDREASSGRIVRLISVGDREAALGNNAQATCTYYSIFQPGLCDDPSIGLRRLAPLGLYEVAAGKLRAVAGRYAEQLIEHGCYLPEETASGIIGVPRGALNLYLISNQYERFAETALELAVEQWPKRHINRFLMSLIRARLNHLEKVRACATLLEEEQTACIKLATFEARLQAHLARHHAESGTYPTRRCRRSRQRATSESA